MLRRVALVGTEISEEPGASSETSAVQVLYKEGNREISQF
jgi:hypothetical protein